MLRAPLSASVQRAAMAAATASSHVKRAWWWAAKRCASRASFISAMTAICASSSG